MKKTKKKFKIDWSSKLIDLLIVVIGISIAFQLNNFNESKKSHTKEKDYLRSFSEDNSDNEINLSLALEFTLKTKDNIDTLKQILLSKDYQDDRILTLSTTMMSLSDFNPSLVTMENIMASGDFDLISDFAHREKLIDTYNAYETTSQFEGLLSDYVKQYVTPFFFNNVKFSDFTSLNTEFIKSAEFENIIYGYDALLSQKIKGYENNGEKLKELNELLNSSNKGYKQ